LNGKPEAAERSAINRAAVSGRLASSPAILLLALSAGCSKQQVRLRAGFAALAIPDRPKFTPLALLPHQRKTTLVLQMWGKENLASLVGLQPCYWPSSLLKTGESRLVARQNQSVATRVSTTHAQLASLSTGVVYRPQLANQTPNTARSSHAPERRQR